MSELTTYSWISLTLIVIFLFLWTAMLIRRKSKNESVVEWLSTNWSLVLFISQICISSIQPFFGILSVEQQQTSSKYLEIAKLVFGDLSALYLALSVMGLETFRFSVFWRVPDDRIYKLPIQILRLIFIVQVAISIVFVGSLVEKAQIIADSVDDSVLTQSTGLRLVAIPIFYIYNVAASMIFSALFFLNVYIIKSDILNLQQQSRGEKDFASRSENSLDKNMALFQRRAIMVAFCIFGSFCAFLATIVIYSSSGSEAAIVFTNRLSLIFSQCYLYHVTRLSLQMTHMQ